MVKNKWYKNSLEVASINDAFIREKMGAILWMILILVGMISVFCLVVYALKLRLDIIKEDKHIKLFQILGYTKQRQTGALYFGKMIETLLSFITGSIIAYNTWNYLCKQKIFLGLVTMMDERADFQLLVIWIVLLVFVIWNFLIIFWVIKKTLF
jgi:Predicted permease.